MKKRNYRGVYLVKNDMEILENLLMVLVDLLVEKGLITQMNMN